MHFSSILTVLDKPKHRQTALNKTLWLQQHGAGSAELVSFYWNAMLDSATTFSADQRRKMRHEMLTSVKAWQEDLLHSKISTRHREDHNLKFRSIWSNDIAQWLSEQTQKRRYDLIVKSIHKNKTLLYTPTDWKILRSVKVPVLLTGGKALKAAKKKGPVLAALDFKTADAKHRHLNARVLQAGADYAELLGTDLHVVFAVEISQVLRDLDLVDAKVSRKKILEKIAPLVDRTVRAYGLPKNRLHFPVGKAGQVINQQAYDLKASTVVVGSCAHKVQQSMGLGNTAERILWKARSDVLVVSP